MSTPTSQVEKHLEGRYKHGFVTDIESDSLPPGLNEGVIAAISARKQEPQWLLDWRLGAYRKWLKMREPDWAHLKIDAIDFQAISYYSAPKSDKDRPKSLDEVDPKLLETYDKLGVPLHERARLAGVAVDAVFDSVSVGTTLSDLCGRSSAATCLVSPRWNSGRASGCIDARR
jgi:Fe-S cluster assembly protein SufB